MSSKCMLLLKQQVWKSKNLIWKTGLISINCFNHSIVIYIENTHVMP